MYKVHQVTKLKTKQKGIHLPFPYGQLTFEQMGHVPDEAAAAAATRILQNRNNLVILYFSFSLAMAHVHNTSPKFQVPFMYINKFISLIYNLLLHQQKKQHYTLPSKYILSDFIALNLSFGFYQPKNPHVRLRLRIKISFGCSFG